MIIIKHSPAQYRIQKQRRGGHSANHSSEATGDYWKWEKSSNMLEVSQGQLSRIALPEERDDSLTASPLLSHRSVAEGTDKRPFRLAAVPVTRSGRQCHTGY
ncbi:hypothetical protein E2C01_043496 [Portunus trituberculatus]|uniref:Uncharacterized protein n=1 Tax=Portunus trituberculatus TaxID=210409 RepID=A0A5B7FWJ0_PORTR|nr:hypothetical protein [Portunus trituberculatus]